MQNINVPIVNNDENKHFQVGDMFYITGYIFTGRDAVLPKIVDLIENGKISECNFSLEGSVIFHTAVSDAGIGPTSSNKAEIEGSMEVLSSAGVKIHLGKGAISKETISALSKHHAYYAITPPLSALLTATIVEKKVLLFEELGMEAFHLLKVENFPIIIAAANGESLY